MKTNDITGFRAGRLVAVRFFDVRPGGKHRWLCQCDCGQQKVVYKTHLLRANSRSCGCLNSEVTAAKNIATAKHGMWKSNEFAMWQSMLQRCLDSNCPAWHHYGGRGVVVCQEWRESFRSFYEFMGVRPSRKHSLERIDNEKGYEPGNVRWATWHEQARNKRNNRIVEVDGAKMVAADFSNAYNVSGTTLRRRLAAGLTGADLTAPPRKYARQRGATDAL